MSSLNINVSSRSDIRPFATIGNGSLHQPFRAPPDGCFTNV